MSEIPRYKAVSSLNAYLKTNLKILNPRNDKYLLQYRESTKQTTKQTLHDTFKW